MIRFSLRLLLITIVRFVLIFSLAFFAESFDVSPLPSWTLALFVYATLFIITYMAARWALHNQAVTRRIMVMLFIVMIIGETLLEAWIQLAFMRWDWSIIYASLTWSRFIPLAVNILAISYAVVRKQRQRSHVL